MLSARDSKIIRKILNDPVIKTKELEEQLHLTKRQINYSIHRINMMLDDAQVSTIKRTHQGTFIIEPILKDYLWGQISVVGKPQNAVGRYIYRNEYQRANVILLYLMISNQNISLINLYDFLQVSKTTVVSDLHKTNELINKYDITVDYSRKDGYLIRGNEKKIRLLLNEVTNELLRTSQGLLDIESISTISSKTIIHFVHVIEEKMGLIYSDDAFQHIVHLLQVTLSREQSGKIQEDNFFHNQVQNTTEYYYVVTNLPEQWALSNDSIEWLTLVFITSNVLYNANQLVDDKLTAAVSEMIVKFEKKTLIDISDHKAFEAKLLLHLRPAFFRVKYGLTIENPGVKSAMENNINQKNLAKIVSQIIEPIEKLAGKKFPEDEIDLISFYFGAELERRPSLPAKLRAAVVCSNGIVTAKIMFETLRQLFPEISFLTTCSVRSFEKYQGDYDIVFTTIKLETSIEQYIVSPVMSEQEKIALRFRVLSEVNNYDTNLDNLMTIISDYAEVRDTVALKNKLRNYLTNSTVVVTNANNVQYPGLINYLDIRRISIIDRNVTWREAIKIAGSLLLEDNRIVQSYLDKIITTTSLVNNYSFLGTEMAIPHAAPEDGVLNDGFSLVIVPDGVIFPDSHKIKIIVMIAIKDSSKHIHAIQQLDQLANDKTMFSKLLDSKNLADIYKLLSKFN